MGTITVYEGIPDGKGGFAFSYTATERQNGMMHLGSELRSALSKTPPALPTSDNDAEARCFGVINTLLGDAKYKVLFEHNDGSGNVRYLISQVPGAPYRLTNTSNPADTKNLNLKGKLDDAPAQTFQMNFVVPRTSGNSGSWEYLNTDVKSDLDDIQDADDSRDYLISTFMFRRCR